MGKATTTTLFLGVDPEVNGGLAVVAIVEGAATGVVSAPRRGHAGHGRISGQAVLVHQ